MRFWEETAILFVNESGMLRNKMSHVGEVGQIRTNNTATQEWTMRNFFFDADNDGDNNK
jgi:hypothetical protein